MLAMSRPTLALSSSCTHSRIIVVMVGVVVVVVVVALVVAVVVVVMVLGMVVMVVVVGLAVVIVVMWWRVWKGVREAAQSVGRRPKSFRRG